MNSKFLLLTLIALAGLGSASAAEATGAPDIPKPNIPAKDFDITQYGAKSDPSSNNAQAIQKAIDAASAAGGGRIVIPSGDYLSGPISLKSNTDLHLDKGARLLMSTNFADFPAEKNNRISFITARDLHDVRISGEGLIDGQGKPWWDAYLATKGKNSGEPRRPQMILIDNCERVELNGFGTLNPPNTHCCFPRSRQITITGLKMNAPGNSPNTDALNLSSVKNVLISNCEISTGDDNVVFLCGGKPMGEAATANATVKDCKLGAGHGMSIGSFTSGGVKNILIENLDFNGTTSGFRLKSGANRGGGVTQDITARHLTMRNVRYPIFISSYYPKPPKGPAEDLPREGTALPEWKDILVEDVTILESPNSITVWALPDKPARGLVFRNIKASTGVGAFVFHADATFSNVQITPASGPVLQTFAANIKGLDGVPFQGEYKSK